MVWICYVFLESPLRLETWLSGWQGLEHSLVGGSKITGGTGSFTGNPMRTCVIP